MDAFIEFNSLEGLDSQYCVNFTAAWQKYALDGIYDRIKLNTDKLITNVLGDLFTDISTDFIGGGTPTYEISNELYNQVNLANTEIQIETGNADSLTYIIKQYKKKRSNGKLYDTSIIMMKPYDFLQIITSSRCVKEFRKYFIKFASIRRAYERTYLPWIISEKDKIIIEKDEIIGDIRNKLDTLINMNTGLMSLNVDQVGKINTLMDMNTNQAGEITKLINHVVETKAIVAETKEIALATYNSMKSFLQLFLSTGTATSIFKSILDNHNSTGASAIENKWYPGLLKMKVMAFVGFYANGGMMYVYSIARNLGNSYNARIKELYEKHKLMTMFNVEVISLIGCDVNEESTVLRNGRFYPNSRYVKKYKRMEIHMPKQHISFTAARLIFMNGVDRARDQRFHNYQNIIDSHLASTTIDNRSKTAIRKINTHDVNFHNEVFNELINFSTTNIAIDINRNGFIYDSKLDTNRIIRDDYLDDEMNNREYALARLYTVLNGYNITEYIRTLNNDGLITTDEMID
jgi:hypothetical protein